MSKVEVELLPPEKGSKGTRYGYSLYVDGEKQSDQRIDPKSVKHQQQIAKEAGVEKAVVLGWLDSMKTATEPKKFLASSDAGRDPLRLTVRGIEQTRDQGTVYEGAPGESPIALFRRVLDLVGPDRIVEWPKADADRLAMLDIDYHDPSLRPSSEWVESLVQTKLKPLGPVWNMTRNGGVHVYFEGTDRLQADELAALAALNYKGLDPTAGVEIKTVTRGLPAGRRLMVNPDTAVMLETALKWLSGGIEDGGVTPEVEEWLEEHGLELGRRYPHEQCPIDPSPSHADPVVVGDDGVFCHKCQSLGASLRGGRPGFVPWSLVVGGGDSPVLRTLVANQSHWGHAKWVLRAALGLTGPIAKAAYSAAIKLAHADRETALLSPLVFHPDTDYLVRFDGYWGTVEEGHVYPKDIDDLLAVTPAANVVNEDGKVVASRSAIALLKQTTLKIALIDRGYPAVQVIRGVRLYRTYADPTRLVVPYPAPWLENAPLSRHPKYVDRKHRMPIAKAQEILEGVLPGIHWTYLKLLILARAANEARYGLPQHLLVTGVSKAGKTSHVKLAAGILGDVASEPLYVADSDKFRSQVRDASLAGSFISFDEFIKNTVRANPRLSPVQAMDPLLNFTPSSLSHKMYVGPVKMGHPGVCVWTETWIPEAIKADQQIARRVHYLSLARKVEWEAGLARNGISEIEKIRTLSDDTAAACNAILSDIMDEHLGSPKTFGELAGELGVPALEHSPEFYDPIPKLRAFYLLVCQAGDPDKGDVRRFDGAGWKVIRRDDDQSDLASIWAHLADGNGVSWLTSRQVMSRDWGSILGVPHEVRCDVRNDGENRVAVRFRVGTMESPVLLNAQITEGVDDGKADAVPASV